VKAVLQDCENLVPASRAMEVDVSACHSDLPQKPWSATPTRKYQPSLSTEVLLFEISVSSTPLGLNSGERMAYYELLIPGGNVIVVHMDEDQLTESMLGKRTVAVEAWGQAPGMEEPGWIRDCLVNFQFVAAAIPCAAPTATD
jgi:hypothetical protein